MFNYTILPTLSHGVNPNIVYRAAPIYTSPQEAVIKAAGEYKLRAKYQEVPLFGSILFLDILVAPASYQS